MPLLQLRNQLNGELMAFDVAEIEVGREPSSGLVVTGQGAEVVSGRHARFVCREGRWWVEDLRSRNGTFVNGARLATDAARALAVGDLVGLGARGPRFGVEAMVPSGDEPEADPGPTLSLDSAGDREAAASWAPTPPPPPMAPPIPFSGPPHVPQAPMPGPRLRGITVALTHEPSGQRYQASGGRIRLGRGTECELRPVASDDTSVSRVHAEIVLRPDGAVVIRDHQSRNGTFVNGERVTGDRTVAPGDRLKLGPKGLELTILDLGAGLGDP